MKSYIYNGPFQCYAFIYIIVNIYNDIYNIKYYSGGRNTCIFYLNKSINTTQ